MAPSVSMRTRAASISCSVHPGTGQECPLTHARWAGHSRLCRARPLFLCSRAGSTCNLSYPRLSNKDLAFAGCVALFLGPDERIAAVIAGVALLMLVAELVVLLLAQLLAAPPAQQTMPNATASKPIALAG